MISQWIDSLFEWGILIVTKWFGRMRFIIQQVLMVVISCLFVLWTAMFMYGCFYYTYMPTVIHERELHLHFRSDCHTFGDGYHCSFPEANITLINDHQSELLMRGQSYVVSVTLDMPESLVNQNHGMFMTVLKFYTRNGEVVKSSARSAMLRYKSTLFYTLETLFYLPILLLSSSEQKQIIEVEYFSNYQEDAYKPAMGVFFQVQSRRIEIYKASLKIHATFYGLRYLLFHWPTISAVIGISINCFFISLILLIAWYNLGKRLGEKTDQMKKIQIREDLATKQGSSLQGSSSVVFHSSSRLTKRTQSFRNVENLSSPQSTSSLHESSTSPASLVDQIKVKNKYYLNDDSEETNTLFSDASENIQTLSHGTDAGELRYRQKIVTPKFT